MRVNAKFCERLLIYIRGNLCRKYLFSPVFTISVISLLCLINEFKFKATYWLFYVSYYIEF